MRDLDTFIAGQRDRFEIPGLVLGLVRDGEVVHAGAYGVRDAASGAPVTPDTVFAIGSATKAFTAAVVGALVDDGLVAWDVPVREYLPWFRMHDPVASEQVTVRDLLSHRTGLPRHDLVWYGDPDITRAEMVARIRHLPPNRGFREAWQYNNLGYLTAGLLAGELLGGTWEDAVRKRLLDPMGMSATNFSVRDSQAADDHSLPHDEVDEQIAPIPFRPIDRVGPAGSINSTLNDMLSFIVANTCDGVVRGERVISDATIREMHTAQMVLPIASHFSEVEEAAYGLGWFISNYRGHRVVHHGGNIDGFTAFMGLLPEQRAGMVILTNRGANFLPKILSYSIWDDLLELDPIDWGDRFASMVEALRSGVKESRERARASYASDTSTSHPLSDYTGDFVHPGYGTMRFGLTEDGSALTAHYNELEMTMKHRHYDVFELGFVGRDEVRAPVVFETDAEGDIIAASIRVEPSVEALRFRRAADARLRDPSFLERLAGTWARGPVKLQIDRRGEDTLVLTYPALGTVTLEPHVKLVLRAKEMPALRLEFVLDDDGRAVELLVPGLGTFTPEADA